MNHIRVVYNQIIYRDIDKAFPYDPYIQDYNQLLIQQGIQRVKKYIRDSIDRQIKNNTDNGIIESAIERFKENNRS